MANFPITNKVHVAIVDPIEGWERIWLTIWAWVNPNHDNLRMGSQSLDIQKNFIFVAVF